MADNVDPDVTASFRSSLMCVCTFAQTIIIISIPLSISITVISTVF